MIKYELLKTKHVEDLKKFCQENGTEVPSNLECAFGAFEDDKLVGICCLRKVYQVEPLINISGHAGVTQILAQMVLAVANTLTKEVFALVKDLSLIHI